MQQQMKALPYSWYMTSVEFELFQIRQIDAKIAQTGLRRVHNHFQVLDWSQVIYSCQRFLFNLKQIYFYVLKGLIFKETPNRDLVINISQ